MPEENLDTIMSEVAALIREILGAPPLAELWERDPSSRIWIVVWAGTALTLLHGEERGADFVRLAELVVPGGGGVENFRQEP